MDIKKQDKEMIFPSDSISYVEHLNLLFNIHHLKKVFKSVFEELADYSKQEILKIINNQSYTPQALSFFLSTFDIMYEPDSCKVFVYTNVIIYDETEALPDKVEDLEKEFVKLEKKIEEQFNIDDFVILLKTCDTYLEYHTEKQALEQYKFVIKLFEKTPEALK